MIRVIVLVFGTFLFLMHHYSIRADDSVWIYMYAHENDTPQRVLEITSDTDKMGQCEFFRDLLDQSLADVHDSVFFTCVVPADLEMGELT